MVRGIQPLSVMSDAGFRCMPRGPGCFGLFHVSGFILVATTPLSF